jgi:hypothetical protein
MSVGFFAVSMTRKSHLSAPFHGIPTMFVITRGKPMAKTKRSAVTQKPKELPPVQTVSDLVLGSCYIASLAIAILASLEAFKQFQQDKVWGGVVYVSLAVAGVLFSVFITLWNRRNKKLLRDNKHK